MKPRPYSNLLPLVLCLLPASIFAQGALTPLGAPSPTMKSLDQIEARTIISALPYTITASGSYYLTGNLTATGSGAGITVSADNVTIDLNGFALIAGGSGTAYILNSSNNTYGAFVDMHTGGGAITSTSPWANFYY